jgi:hypothetical protein
MLFPLVAFRRVRNQWYWNQNLEMQSLRDWIAESVNSEIRSADKIYTAPSLRLIAILLLVLCCVCWSLTVTLCTKYNVFLLLIEHQERLLDVPIKSRQQFFLQFLMEYLSVGCNIKGAYQICKLSDLPFWLQHQESLYQIMEYHVIFHLSFPHFQ